MLVIASLVVLALAHADGQSTYATCGMKNSDDVGNTIKATVGRLMQLRHTDWGWTNTPQVVLGLQLAAQREFFAREDTIETMKREITSDLDSMNLGKLALYVLAVEASCQNPRNFSNVNLVEILEKRSRKQYFYNGQKHDIPFDRYYRFSMALGALCVTGEKSKGFLVKRLLNSTKVDGVYGGIHSVDDAAQVLLALHCIKGENRGKGLLRQVGKAIGKVTAFLKTQINEEGEDVWIGNKYSSPSSVLGLKESGEGSPDEWRCSDIMKGLAKDPTPQILEKEGGLSQRLPALKGFSYLALRSNEWRCEKPVPVPDFYLPSCDPENPASCGPIVQPSAAPLISVRLTVFTDGPPSVGTVPNADVTLNDVVSGSTLFEVMTQAKAAGLMTFESRSTAWGQSITSIQGVASDSDAREYWSLIDGSTGKSLTRGASSYVPRDGEQIVFRLKNW